MENVTSLKIARIAKGKSQADMAKIIEKTVGTYSGKERGEVAISLDEVLRIVNALDLSFDEFNAIFFSSKLHFCK